MNIVDSSAWLEFFCDSINAKNFTKVIEDTNNLLVPTIILYEVFKKTLQDYGENQALQIIAHMKQGRVIDIDLEISLLAAKLSAEIKLPMADSLILATAKKHQATIWTQDKDFEGLKEVKFFQKAL